MTELLEYIYPLPKYIKLEGERISSRLIQLVKCEGESFHLGEINFFREESKYYIERPYKLKVTIKEMKEFMTEGFEAELRMNNNEGYAIRIYDHNAVFYGNNYRSVYYAFNTFNKMLESGFIYSNTVLIDFPDMEVRGIIEGYYGRPWSFKERCEAISTISKHNMNTYIYAPKDDKYHRSNWRECYSKQDLSRIEKLFLQCRRKCVDFYYTLSPGLSIKYSDIEEESKLYNKYMQLFNVGVRSFGILFDDIPNELVYDEDKLKYGSIYKAHSELVSKLYKFLKSKDESSNLIVCPTLYHGRGDEEYIKALGNNIPDDVQIFWTGRSICSQELDTRDAKYFYENTGHKPLYWDNYPVNDAMMEYEMHLGPIKGRDTDLYKYSYGLISNVMEYKEASMIPVITIAHYLWNSNDYNSSLSMRKAVAEIAGSKDSENFMRFASYCLKSCLNPVSSDEFIDKAVQLKHATSIGEISNTLTELEKYFQGNFDAGQRLVKEMVNKKLKKETKKWILKYIDFNKLCYYIIKCVEHFHQGRKFKSSIVLMKVLSLSSELNKNPIQMMNFETKALMDSVKESVKIRPKL